MRDIFDFPSRSGSEAGSEPESECRDPPPDKSKRKRGPRPERNEGRAWFAQAEINFEFDPTLSLEARTNLLKERIKDKLSHNQPTCVHAYEAHVDSNDYSGNDGKYSFPVTFYLQTRNTTKIPLETWFGEETEVTLVKGGLYGNEFYDADRKKPPPWVVLRLFSTIKLNNAGRAASAAAEKVTVTDCPIILNFYCAMLLIDT